MSEIVIKDLYVGDYYVFSLAKFAGLNKNLQDINLKFVTNFTDYNTSFLFFFDTSHKIKVFIWL